MSEIKKDYDRRLFKKLRIGLWVPSCQMTNEEVWKIAKGTFLEAGARVEIFQEDLSECFAPVVKGLLAVMLWITRRMQR